MFEELAKHLRFIKDNIAIFSFLFFVFTFTTTYLNEVSLLFSLDIRVFTYVGIQDIINNSIRWVPFSILTHLVLVASMFFSGHLKIDQSGRVSVSTTEEFRDHQKSRPTLFRVSILGVAIYSLLAPVRVVVYFFLAFVSLLLLVTISIYIFTPLRKEYFMHSAAVISFVVWTLVTPLYWGYAQVESLFRYNELSDFVFDGKKEFDGVIVRVYSEGYLILKGDKSLIFVSRDGAYRDELGFKKINRKKVICYIGYVPEFLSNIAYFSCDPNES